MSLDSASSSPLEVDLAGVRLRNPVVLAAGTCGYVDEMSDVLDLRRVGAIVTKSITVEPREGNPHCRIVDAQCGMLNAIGLANVGLTRFMQDHLPKAGSCGTVVIGSIAGNSIAEYVKIAAAFDSARDIPLVELNVSCPNTADGLVFGEDPSVLEGLLQEIRPVLSQTRLIVKLSPNAPSIVAMAEAAVNGGVDAVSLVNTFTALAIDVETRRPRLSRGIGGLSGPAIHPVAVRMVSDVHRQVTAPAGVPLVAYGGVARWQDAAEFILAGATAVGMGTALFVDPTSPVRVVRGLKRWVGRQGVGHISELVGALELPD